MPKTLVVVESPAKAKTIEKYLGGDYTVRASYGHIRDLPKSQLGVDLEHDFAPEYMVPEDSERHVRELKALKKADDLVLATDYDREGEAIAFHVATILGVSPDVAKRVTFTEITKDAILEAFRHPREIDLKLVDAQQARRILDRLVGYRISPLLWKRVRPGSVGGPRPVGRRAAHRRTRARDPRVQPGRVLERRRPAHARGRPEQPFLARLVEIPEGKVAASPDKKGVHLGAEADAAQHVERLNRAAYRVANVEQKERKRSPAPPFTTSTLQQEAARKLGFSARKTMTLAQRLYEGIDLPGEGQRRAHHVHADRLGEHRRHGAARDRRAGQDRVRAGVRARRAAALQDALAQRAGGARGDPPHQRCCGRQIACARSWSPTSSGSTRLIWQRTVATQMAEARFNQVGVDIEARHEEIQYGLRATGQTLVFDGFIRIYFEGRDDAPDEDAESMLPELTAEQLLRMLEVLPEQHFTQPPPRFSEASLVKTLEELGIGRPSTYASIISTIQDRGYVRLEDKRFYPEDVGMVVTDKLIEHFPDVVDVNFTAHMEDELDDIAEGELGWTQVLHEFNGPFERALEKAEDSFERYEEELDEPARSVPRRAASPGKLQVKLGRFGKFIGCPNYPGVPLHPQHGRDRTSRAGAARRDLPRVRTHKLQERVGRFGPFVGCSGYPECKYIKKEPPKTTGVTCPECKQGELVERQNRFGTLFYSCDRYPECTFAVSNPPIADHPCPECGSLLLQRPKSVKCWNCGAELDLEFNVTKSGDVEGEAAARAAKSVAKAARAAAKAKKAPAKKKTAAKKRHGRPRRSAPSRKTAKPQRPAPSRRPCPTRRRPSGSCPASPTRSPRSAEPSRRPSRTSWLTRRSRGCSPAMTVSSLGDWVGFVAVTSLVARLSGSAAAAGLAVGGGDDRADAARDPVRSVRRGARRPARPQADHDRRRHRARRDVRVDAVPRPVFWLIFVLSFFIECLSLLWTPARDASLPNLVPRRQLANANSIGLVSTYATLPLGGAIFALLASISRTLGRRPVLPTHPESLPLLARRRHVRVLRVHGEPRADPYPGAPVDGTLRPLARMARHRRRRAVPPRGLDRVGDDDGDRRGVRRRRRCAVRSGPAFAASTLGAKTAGWPILVTAFGVGMGIGMAGSNEVAKVFERDLTFVWSLVAAAGALFVLAAMPNLWLAAVVTVWLGRSAAWRG